MPNTTPNLGLIKPLVTEQYDIAKVTNENADKIDLLLAPKANPTFTGTQTLPNIVTNGIKFPATQVPSSDPNTLDDYEKGTFTPVLKEGVNVMSVTSAIGSYTKIGNIVHFQINILNIVRSGTGDLTIDGLPFTSLAGVAFPMLFHRSTLPSGGYDRIARLDGTTLILMSNPNSNVNFIAITASQIAEPSQSDIFIQGSYQI